MDHGWLALLDAPHYTIAREILQRGVAAIMVVAFLSTLNQFPALLGEHGLLPAPRLIERMPRGRGTPSIFRIRRIGYSDALLRAMCIIGAGLGVLVVLGLPQMGWTWIPPLVFLAMWAMYLSIVSVGQVFYGFGWESLLLECAFVVGFLGSHEVAPPALILLFVRFLVIRVEFGAGMIKMRGDSSWRDLTAMDYHHQTQPMPGPLSRWAHLKPRWWHRAETLGSHIVQLGLVWLVVLPQPFASIGAACIIITQLALVVTGNYAWLNWLTIIVAASAISDGMWGWLLGGPWPGWGWEHIGRTPGEEAGSASGTGLWHALGADAGSPLWWTIVVVLVFALLAYLSWPSLKNLFSSGQLMNASFNRWHLVNAYGAFGSMTEQRRELIIEGRIGDGPWEPYGFKGKPGDVDRRSRQFAPYHLRLDWMMWFLALGSWNAVWFARFLKRLLEADPATLKLLGSDPFDGQRPDEIRVLLYDYRYATPAEHRKTGQWWVRDEIGTLVRPISLADFRRDGVD